MRLFSLRTLTVVLSALAVNAAVAEPTVPLHLSLPPGPAGEWRGDVAQVQPRELPSREAAAVRKEMFRRTADHVDVRQAPPGDGFVWRVVLLIYPSIDCSQTVAGVTSQFSYTFTPSELDEATSAARGFVTGVYEGSNHEARIQLTTVVVGRTITSLARFGDDVHWPDPAITAPELLSYCVGQADSAIVYWPVKNTAAGTSIHNPYWGLSYGTPAAFTYNVGYSTVNNIQSPVHPTYYPGEIFIHEWMHPTTDYYRAKWNCTVPNLDTASSYRPCAACPNYALVPGDGWMPFYRDFLQGKVYNPATGLLEGLPPSAWRSGTPIRYTGPSAAARDWNFFE